MQIRTLAGLDLPKSLWRFHGRIKTFGPSAQGYRVELRTGLVSDGNHFVVRTTIRDMVYALGNVGGCKCTGCADAPIEEKTPGAMLAAMRRNKYGGRQAQPTYCPRCGEVCESATLARKHCRRPQSGRPPVPTHCRCGVLCATRAEARDHCRRPRVRRVDAAKTAATVV